MTKSSIASFLKANFIVGLPLFIILLFSLQYNRTAFDGAGVYFFIQLGVLLSIFSALIGVVLLVPAFHFAVRRGFASYFSIVLFSVLPAFCFYLVSAKSFYLYCMVISGVIGLVFFKLAHSSAGS